MEQATEPAAEEDVPAGQEVHAAAPATEPNLPPGQEAQSPAASCSAAEVPASARYDPLAQSWHAAAAVAALVVLYFPATQIEQSERPSCLEASVAASER